MASLHISQCCDEKASYFGPVAVDTHSVATSPSEANPRPGLQVEASEC